jgi:hypothetical protein
MIQSLQVLRLVLGQPSVSLFMAQTSMPSLTHRYRWKCGCEALGKDSDELAVTACVLHDVLFVTGAVR